MSCLLRAASLALLCGACSRTGLGVPDARRDTEDARAVRVDATSEICDERLLELGATEPTIAFVIDRSGSMNRPFGATDGRPTTRWRALVDVLVGGDVGAGGVLGELEGRARLGGTTFWQDFVDTCPNVFWVRPELGNAVRLGAYLSAQVPGGGTPTAEAVTLVTEILTASPDHRAGDSVIVLATDGEPTGCNSIRARDESVAAVRAARVAGIETRIISVGIETAREHLQELADAGRGIAGAPFYVATDEAALSSALDDVVGAAVACRAHLPERAWWTAGCRLDVRVGGVRAECAAVDGFDVEGEVLVLHGPTCDRAEAGEPVRVGLPCL